jgi:GR25 family glycosyltransferase involved in LPS biosynthesis
MNDGLNNIDKIYFINLDHRKDRYEHITNELKKTNIDQNKINKIKGIYIKELGILGCAKSHCLALEAFINSDKINQTCLILEDDFEFTKDQTIVNELINKFFNKVKNFDVLMLSANILNAQPTEYDFIQKIIDAQTLSGYIVNRNFAKILLNNYRESILLLERAGYKAHPFCFDIYMKRLQPYNNWYCINPKVGKQIESYSDIETRVDDYEC